jgi:hypothetical protein
MNVTEFIKQHYGKIFVGTSGTIIFTVAGIFFSDARYVHQNKYKEQITELRQEIADLKAKVNK